MKKNTILKPLTRWILLGSTFIAGTAFAETQLDGLDGNFSLTGKLISVDDENYTIETEFGQLIVRREFVKCSGDGCPDAVDESAQDDKVELASVDGSIRLEGSLVEVTATDYVIETVTGKLTVRKEFVSCNGASCPETAVVASSFSVAVPSSVGQELLTTIVGDFASSKDYSLTQTLTSGGSGSLLVGNNRGEEVAKISVNSSSEQDALKSVLDGETAMAYTRSRVTPEQLSQLTGRRVSNVSDVLNEEAIGLDALSFVVNSSNRLNVVNLNQIRAVLTGQITNWSQLGGANRPISVHMIASDAGTDQLLRDRVMQGQSLAANITRHEDAEQLNEAVNADNNAIGLIYRSQAKDLKSLDLVSTCSVFFNNDDFSIQTEEYPLAVRWYQYSAKSQPLPDFASSIEGFTATDYGQESIASKGFVTQALRVAAMKDQGARILSTVLASGNDQAANRIVYKYVDEISTAERISTSLRFLSGSTNLDVKAIADIKRISEIVRSADYEGYEFLIFGFSDSYGDLNANLALSLGRADVVKNILLNENRGYLENSNVTTFGVGPIAPVGCNDTARGRELNRRVEIWVRPKA